MNPQILRSLAVVGLGWMAQADASTIFVENFDSYSVGEQSPGAWVYTDANNIGDHSSRGVRANGDSSGGSTVTTRTASGQFLNGGRSAIYSHLVATIVEGTSYTFSVWGTNVGSSYALSRSYFSTALPVAPVTHSGGASSAYNTPDQVASNASGTGQAAQNGWNQYEVTYVGTLADAGKSLYINLESHRDVSTAVRGWDDVEVTAVAVPEPSSLSLLGLGLSCVALRRKRA
ncbi:PEP-CTERM sorting domain-containing protein [Rubritalea tangerina]|uniref:PEP-CTERM sorting domain-containing protein n=2 Tax=Rubritalea tangerina TaxID=430798 RepID=A0ABW4ZD36_9BACT